MCVEQGDLRAFLDGELPSAARTEVQSHLQACPSCRRRMELLEANALVARLALDLTAPGTEVQRPAWSLVQNRAAGLAPRPVTRNGGTRPMLEGLFGLLGRGRVRVALSVMAASAMVVLLASLSPVQTMAGSLLSIFRVQRFVTVQVDPSAMPRIASPGELGTLTTSGDATVRRVTAEQAEQAVGFKIPTVGRLPADLEAKPWAITVTGARSVTFTPDLKKVRAYLASIGAGDISLPVNLDGAPITLQIPAGVMELYLEKGGGRTSTEGVQMPQVGQHFLYVGATSSPTMTVPDGLDVERIRAEALKMPGLPAELVSQLKAIDDWRNTVVVPVVKGSSHEVIVQGQSGVAIVQPDGKGATLIWARDGKVFAVSGSFSESELLAVANSLR